MFYIPSLNFVYLAGPKTGSVSAIQYLIALSEAHGLETRTYNDFDLPEHCGHADVRAALAAAHPGAAPVFCTHIRHPVARVLSFFHFARLDRSLVPWWQPNHRPDDQVPFNVWFNHPGAEPADELAYCRWTAVFRIEAFCGNARGPHPVTALRLEDGMHILRNLLIRQIATSGLDLTLPPLPETPLNTGDSMAIEKGIALPARQVVELTEAQAAQIRADWAMDMRLGSYR